MISTYWLEKRKSHWLRLEHLLDQSHKQGLKSLTRSELQELGLLYRQAAADLSAVREDPTAQYYSRSLNLLLARAHNIIYSGEKSSPFNIVHFYRYTYPGIFRRQLPLVTVAFLLFMAGAVAGLLMSVIHPEFMRSFLGPAMMESLERHEMWTKSVVSVKPLAASGIMTNNMTVAFLAFALGIIPGLGALSSVLFKVMIPDTVTLLVFNGMMLGVVGAACWFYGMSLSLWSFVAPHGVLELPAIFIAGGAGLRIAKALLFPGLLSRRESLAQAGPEAVRLLVGTIPILIIAGTIEGFISPSLQITPRWKFTLAAAIATIFFCYLFLPVKGNKDRAQSVREVPKSDSSPSLPGIGSPDR
jgi:uncharacterized membrane protein SpoIIM required for sporulation